MVAKESNYQDTLMDQNPNPIMQDLDEEEEETLSLCDLPIYSDAAESENFSKEYQSSSLSSDQDYFEFFSEEWSTTTYPLNNNVIFCGKLIPYKEPVSIDTHKLENNKHKNPKRRGLFRWNSDSFNKPKASGAKGTKLGPCMGKNGSKLLHGSSSSKSLSSSPVSEKYMYRRVSVVAAPAKPRRSLFMFGLARFPTEMELGDMRNRQYRRAPSATLFRSDGGGEKVSSGGRRRWKGLWGLVRAVGWGSSHRANAVVKASFGCIPSV